MTPEELLKKDFQLLTSQGIIDLLTNMYLILENQSKIMSKLFDTPVEKIDESNKKRFAELKSQINRAVKDKIPEYSYRDTK